MNEATVSRYMSRTSGGLIRASVQFRESQIEQIDQLAEQLGLSRSAIVAQLVEIGLRVKGVEHVA